MASMPSGFQNSNTISIRSSNTNIRVEIRDREEHDNGSWHVKNFNYVGTEVHQKANCKP